MQISVTQNSDSICVSVSVVSVFVPGCRLPLSACYCFRNSCCYGKQQQLLGRQSFMVKIVTITLTWLLLVRASASCFEGTGEATLLHHQVTARICSLASLTEGVCDSKLTVLLSSNWYSAEVLLRTYLPCTCCVVRSNCGSLFDAPCSSEQTLSVLLCV